MNKLVMTPGPTQISEEVRNALSIKNTNTDLDKDFVKLYKDTCDKARKIVNSKDSKAIIMLGEAILGLEAACASFVEEGDEILCIDNGIFGRGFSDFVELYGGKTTIFKNEYSKGIDVNQLEKFIDKNGPFKLATLVHCETPTGVTNPLKELGEMLNNKGIITVVDAVSSYGGEKINMDEWKIDVLLAGTQKCLSVTAGGTIIFLSSQAQKHLINRKSAIKSFYANIKNWLNVIENEYFPYTHSDGLINSINVALTKLLNEDYVKKHADLANKVRKTITNCGLNLYANDHYSNTLTAIEVPEEINFEEMFKFLNEEKNILIGGSLAEFEGKIFRIGHMGENAKEEYIYILLKALDEYFKLKELTLKQSLHVEFSKL